MVTAAILNCCTPMTGRRGRRRNTAAVVVGPVADTAGGVRTSGKQHGETQQERDPFLRRRTKMHIYRRNATLARSAARGDSETSAMPVGFLARLAMERFVRHGAQQRLGIAQPHEAPSSATGGKAWHGPAQVGAAVDACLHHARMHAAQMLGSRRPPRDAGSMLWRRRAQFEIQKPSAAPLSHMRPYISVASQWFELATQAVATRLAYAVSSTPLGRAETAWH